MKSNETYDVRFYDIVPYITLAAVFAVITIITLFLTSVSDKKNSVKNIPSLFVINNGSAEMYSGKIYYIPQKNYVQNKISTDIFLSRDSKIEKDVESFNYLSLKFNKALKSANTEKEKKETSLKAEKTANASAKQKSAKKVVSKRHASYSKGEVTLMANAIYRECGGYYLNAKSYGLTKAQGLRAAIITGVVMRNRRDTVKDYKSITDVLIAPHQYGKGGQDSLNRINNYHAPTVFKKIAKAILDYKEVEIAEELVGDESDFNVKDFQVPKSVYYQSQYSTLGSGKYAQIGNQIYNFK